MSGKNKQKKIFALIAALLVLALGAWLMRPKNRLLFKNSDFELGTLENWRPAGSAFSRQPVLEDNAAFRQAGGAGPQGKYWIGTYENRRLPADPKGRALGDAPRGQLVSKTFTIAGKRIRFLAGGGEGSELTGIVLEVEGKRVLFEPGRGLYQRNEKMHPVIWDVPEWLGKKARIVIVDNATGKWGHINADDFRYTDEIV